MTMTPRLRKISLVAHLTFSVGWLGTVAAFLPLAITAVTSPDVPMVRAAYLAMALVASYGIAPLACISLLSGLVSSLGTSWGLFRHYWVLIKLLLTILAVVVLLIQLGPINRLARVAADPASSMPDLRGGEQTADSCHRRPGGVAGRAGPRGLQTTRSNALRMEDAAALDLFMLGRGQ